MSDTDGATLMMMADDGSLPLRPGETAASVFATRRQLELHSYYPSIADLTFSSRFVPVSPETAEAWRVENRGGRPSPAQRELLDRLKEATADAIAQLLWRPSACCLSDPLGGDAGEGGAGGGGGGVTHGNVARTNDKVFVRLSTRSPKDAVGASPRLRKELVAALRRRLYPAAATADAGPAAVPSDNDVVCALDDCMAELLGVGSAAEAFELVAHSSRCVSDIRRLLEHRESLPGWDLQLIVREHVPLPASSEFRCFVFGGRLCAISQYFSSSFFPELPAAATRVRTRIEQYFAEHGSRIELTDYVLDLAVLESKIWIVELNPYSPSTGACLFDWATDAEALRQPPAEIRVLQAPIAHLDSWLMPWADVVAEVRGTSTGLSNTRGSSDNCTLM